MSEETHPREREVFLQAVEINDEAELTRYLDEACGDDDHLRSRIVILLRYDRTETDLSPPEPDMAKAIRNCNPDAASSASKQPRSGESGWIPPTSGQLNGLLEAYEIEKMIGRGGMGAVYKGEQTSLQRAVAIKILPPEFVEDEEFAKRFRREALAMAKMDHPNLVTIYDFGSVDFEAPEGSASPPGRLFYFVMEFVDGTDLQHLIRSGELTSEAALKLIGQICDALQYAHGEGYIHRDIKPANIFVTKGGVVKVGDFGIAKLAGQNEEDTGNLTIAGHVMGTPHYLAPENLEGDGKIDHRADIFSLGVMFYQMLTGNLPKGAFLPPSQKVEIDVRLDEIVLKAMQAEPDLRYQNVSDVKDDVTIVTSTQATIEEMKVTVPTPKPIHEDAPSSLAQTQNPTSPAGKGQRASERFPVVWTVVGLVALACLGLGVKYGFGETRGILKDYSGNGGRAVFDEISDEVTELAPPGGWTVQFPLPVPILELPNPSKLPRGKVGVWGGARDDKPLIKGPFDEIDDFVEVKLQSEGWVGLRSNGDVVLAEFGNSNKGYRTGQTIATLKRGGAQFSGEFLSRSGSIVDLSHHDRDLAKAAPKSGIIDLAKTDTPEFAYSILTKDKKVTYLGVGSPPPSDVQDFVRIEGGDISTFGIRENGSVACWGVIPPNFDELQNLRFVQMSSSGFYLFALTDQGEVWYFDSDEVRSLNLPETHGPFTEISAGFQFLVARRASDRRWIGWSTESGEEIDATLRHIETLGPNVESLHASAGMVVWLETEAKP